MAKKCGWSSWNVGGLQIYYCYTEWQPIYQEFIGYNVTMIEGLPDMIQLESDPTKTKLLIMDVLIQEQVL